MAANFVKSKSVEINFRTICLEWSPLMALTCPSWTYCVQPDDSVRNFYNKKLSPLLKVCTSAFLLPYSPNLQDVSMHIVHCTIQDAHDLVTMFSISGLQAVAMESGKIWTGLGWVGGGGGKGKFHGIRPCLAHWDLTMAIPWHCIGASHWGTSMAFFHA